MILDFPLELESEEELRRELELEELEELEKLEELGLALDPHYCTLIMSISITP